MAPENFDSLLETMVSRRPFRPFTIELHGGDRFEIDHMGATSWRDGKAMFTSPGGVMIYFNNESVVQIFDAPASDARGRPKKK